MALDARAQLADNLNRLAGMHRLSQAHIAAMLGMTRPATNRVFRGRSHPDIERVEAIAALFGVTVPDLYADSPRCVAAAAASFVSAPARAAERPDR